VDSCPKAEPWEQRGLTLYTLASRLQKQKARSNPYIVIFNFIGYFTLVLRDFPLPGSAWPPSCSDFSGFSSLLCHPYLPATFSGLRPGLFSSYPPPCYTSTSSRHNVLPHCIQKLRFHGLIFWNHEPKQISPHLNSFSRVFVTATKNWLTPDIIQEPPSEEHSKLSTYLCIKAQPIGHIKLAITGLSCGIRLSLPQHHKVFYCVFF
jgi:hypothetical protein